MAVGEIVVKTLGKVGITFGGEWDSTAIYEKLTFVTHERSGYFSKRDVPADIEPGAADDWGTYWQFACGIGVPDISVGTVETLAPGEAVTVTLSGTTEHPVFSFGIPQGFQGIQGETGSTGPEGPRGQTGETGPTGATPSFSVGTVSTLQPGESATASVTGTDENPVLNLGIPQGLRGEQGPTGQTGQTGATGATPNITIGTVGTLSPGSSATATITGTPENPVLSLGIPEGLAGQNGQDGHDGQDGRDGQDGYTPVRGTDYWTAADQQAVIDAAVAAVLAAYPAAEGVSF